MDYIILIAVLTVILLAAGWWIRNALAIPKAGRDESMLLIQNQMNALSRQTTEQMEQLRSSLQQINQHMSQSLDATRKSTWEQLEGTSRVIQNVNKQLVSLEKSTQQIFDVGKDISGLQDILQSPKLRGNISELWLNELLAQVLTAHQYETQYTFRGGETVDAVIRLQSGLVPVDAKFSLENFRRISELEDEKAKKAARTEFIRNVKKHADDIASKYIRTDEGTFDFALMYIPAENVYYEMIVRDDHSGAGSSLLSYALAKRVIPVSPNTFYAYLQTILLGLKGMRVEESARDIMNHLGRLKKEFERFEASFRLVGQHLENSMKKFTEAEKRLGRIEGKMEQIEGVRREEEETPALPEQEA